MNTLLIAVNSQYIHSNLAVWQLKANCTPDCGRVEVEEFNINQQQKWVYAQILEKAPDVAAFSCYIWNITYILSLCAALKAALPEMTLLFGGPEVSFDSESLLRRHAFLDGILIGEGDDSFPEYLRRKNAGRSMEGLEGLCWREGETIRPGHFVTARDFAALPSPYTPEMLEHTKGKILYFEGSRGCPFACAYCLSQISHGVRELPLEQVKQTLSLLSGQGVPLLKFVDRTFNCNPKRAIEIWKYVRGNTGRMKVHFEIGADLLDEEQLALLQTMPQGKIQLEAGVQSTNPDTLAKVSRTMRLDRLKSASRQILSFRNIHYHLDLIAGLPFETYQRFGESFNDVFALRPHQLQLGFLKLLKGSSLREQAAAFGCRYREEPPYEVIATDNLSPRQVVRLYKIEETLERYYNSGRFPCSLELLLEAFPSPFALFEALADWLDDQDALTRPVGAGTQFAQLLAFAQPRLSPEAAGFFSDALRLDYALSGLKGTLPSGLKQEGALPDYKTLARRFTQAGGFQTLSLPAPSGPKDLAAQYRFLALETQPLLRRRKPCVFLILQTQSDPISGRRLFREIPENVLSPFTSKES